MKKCKLNILLLLIIFFLLFIYNDIIKESVLNSINLWLNNIVPFILPMYLIVDLLINYGFINLFKNTYIFLILISFLLGSPSQAKYIKSFYQNQYIDKNTANYLLYFCYSPNPLFLFGILEDRLALSILIYIILTDCLLAIFFNKKITPNNLLPKPDQYNFSKCIEESIFKSFHILLLILGVMIVFNILIVLINTFSNDHFLLIKVLLEITNGINISINNNYILLATSFGGISIYTQIKSILEDTGIKYNNYLIGRIISSIIPLFMVIFD